MSQINESAGTFLRESLLPEMRAYLAEQKFSEASLHIDEDDPQTLRFFYPQSFADDSILQEIRLASRCLSHLDANVLYLRGQVHRRRSEVAEAKRQGGGA